MKIRTEEEGAHINAAIVLQNTIDILQRKQYRES